MLYIQEFGKPVFNLKTSHVGGIYATHISKDYKSELPFTRTPVKSHPTAEYQNPYPNSGLDGTSLKSYLLSPLPSTLKNISCYL